VELAWDCKSFKSIYRGRLICLLLDWLANIRRQDALCALD